MMVAISGQLCGTVLIVALINSWVRRRRQDPRALEDGVSRIEARLSEMQHAIDTVALEVERISEGQRFTTKLLADRGLAEREGAANAAATERSAIRR